MSNRLKSRLTDPLTYVGLAAFGGLFGIKELASLGVPEVATGMAALGGILASLFGATKDEKAADQAKDAPQ